MHAVIPPPPPFKRFVGMERGVVKQAHVLIKCDAFFKYFVAHNRYRQSGSLRALGSSGSRFVTKGVKIQNSS